METQRWRQIDSILQLALDRDASDRDELLEVACGDDSDLRSEVERLLDLEAQDLNLLGGLEEFGADAEFLDQRSGSREGVRSGTVDPFDPYPGSSHLRPGDRVGAYRILGLLGHGGMGSVYRAERDDKEIVRQVALKVSRSELVSRETLRRFRQERQILGSLDHPNIARLIDVGATDQGRPYVVMELVEGIPIDVYCDQQGLGVRERLELVLKVCAAVSKAHQSLIVHRDLKPNNILVGADGEPKLLDFGIAKPLDPESFPTTITGTRDGFHPMTPDYASPEQVQGLAIRTTSDVYSLGVVIYELLTGQLPRPLAGLAPVEMLRAVAEDEVLPPSRVVADSVARSRDVLDGGREEGASISERWGCTAKQLSRELSGDLDTILLKALRNDPDRRYQAVDELSEDLLRHLEARPVLARPETLTYLTTKFVQRHRATVLVGLALLLSLVGFGTNLMFQTQRLAAERDRADTSRKLAAIEQQKAEEVAAVMTGIFEQSDPHNALGEDITARELLDQSAERIKSQDSLQPEVRATVLQSIGNAFVSLGRSDEAEPLLAEALSLREETLGPDHLDVAASLLDLASVFHTRAEYDRARPLLQRSIGIRERALGENHVSIVPNLKQLGGAYWVEGRFQEAEVAWTRALEIEKAEYGADHVEVAHDEMLLGILYEYSGRLDEALDAYTHTLEIFQRDYAPFHPAMATIHNNLGVLYGKNGLYLQALPHLEQALEIREKIYTNNEALLGTIFANLGDSHRHLGNFESAERLGRRALEVLQASAEPDHSFVWAQLAELHRDQGDLQRAESTLARGFAALEIPRTESHPSLALLLATRGEILFARGEYRAALPVLQEAEAMLTQIYGPDNRRVLANAGVLGWVQTRLGELDQAEAAFERARLGWERLFARFPWAASGAAGLADTHLGLGELYRSRGDLEAARAAWSRSIELLEGLPDQGPVPRFLDLQARALLLTGQVEAAKPLVEKLQSIGWEQAALRALVREHGLEEGLRR